MSRDIFSTIMAKTKAGPAALRKAMTEAGMMQTEMERQLGVSVGTANRWLSGVKRPDLDHLLAIRAKFGVELDVWAGAGRRKPKRKAPSPPAAAGGRA